jgi:hypothetical protein
MAGYLDDSSINADDKAIHSEYRLILQLTNQEIDTAMDSYNGFINQLLFPNKTRSLIFRGQTNSLIC